MKKLAALVVVAVLVGLYLAADVVVRGRVESTLAKRIEADVPGTTATVTIHSFPFTGHLATSGTVPSLVAAVSGVRVGPFPVQSVTLAVSDLVIDRGQLVQGTVKLDSVRAATVTATVTEAGIDAGTGLPVKLGDGTVGIGPISAPARVSVTAGSIDLTVAGLHTISLPLLPAALLPCALDGVVRPGALVVSCTTTTIPAALVQAVSSATSS